MAPPARGAADEAINRELRSHAEGLEDWELRPLVQDLYAWSDRFNAAFALELEPPVIVVDWLPRGTLGQYRQERSGLGLRHEVTVNRRHLPLPPAVLLVIVLHELLHEWELLHGKPCVGQYHGRAYRLKAAEYGLVVGPGGQTKVEPGAFTRLLEEHGVDTAPLFVASALDLPLSRCEGRSRSGSRLQKISCGCAEAWSLHELQWACRRCGQPVQTVDADQRAGGRDGSSDHEAAAPKAARQRATRDGGRRA